MERTVQTDVNEGEIRSLFERQKAFFNAGKTMPRSFRTEQIRALDSAIRKYEGKLIDALQADMRKPAIEAFGGEIGFVYKEIRHALKNLRSWMRDRRVPTDLAHFPSHSWIQHRPKGVVLVLSPWNYPFNLVMTPLVGAMAAGNCSIVKPSEEAANTAELLGEMISSAFDPEYISVVKMPGEDVIQNLITPLPFDHIFFTGSERAGRQVLRAAAEHLTPVTLELGGKSPALVLPDADLALSAKRIVWGKFFNAGQTCVAPDYALVQEQQLEALTRHMIDHIEKFHGTDPLLSEKLTGIINQRRFDVLSSFIDTARVFHGGRRDDKRLVIEPTLIYGDLDHVTMKGEIFGPVLPLVPYRDERHAREIIQKNPDPLAFYLFTKSRKEERKWMRSFAFGGGGVNTALVHVASSSLPFGGVGKSGMGRYHGKYSFELFSHAQGITKTSRWPDIPLRYPPYTRWKEKMARLFFG